MRVDKPGEIDFRKAVRNSLIFIGVGLVFILLKIYAGANLLILIEKWTLLNLYVAGNLLVIIGILTLLNIYVLSPLSQRFRGSFLPWLEAVYTRVVTYAINGRKPIYFFWRHRISLVSVSWVNASLCP